MGKEMIGNRLQKITKGHIFPQSAFTVRKFPKLLLSFRENQQQVTIFSLSCLHIVMCNGLSLFFFNKFFVEGGRSVKVNAKVLLKFNIKIKSYRNRDNK